jgi:hypothetical protein
MSKYPRTRRPASRGLVFLCAVAAAFFISAAPSIQPAALAGAAPTPSPTPTPGPPVKLVFDPPDPSVRPGTQITITVTALDKDNRQVAGGTYEFKLADDDHKKFVIHRPEGNKLVVSGLFAETGDGGEKQGREMISLVPFIVTYTKDDPTKPITRVLNVSLNDAARPPGPVPPGLKPQVDVMWDVLPGNVVLANFGRKVRGDYYGIQIVIGNNSGYDLQIASAGFKLKHPVPTPSGANFPLPTASYQLARGSLAREQEIGLHARFVNTFDALGPVFTGFLPFFHVVNHRSNFSQLINVFSNPFNAGSKLLFPDTTIGQLGRLEQQTFRNDQTARTIIPSNTQISIVTFFPKKVLTESLRRMLRDEKGLPDGKMKKAFEDPLNVMEALGDLVLVGQQVQYLNRVRLVGDEARRDTANVSGRVLDGCNNGVADVKLSLAGGPFFKGAEATTKADGTYLFQGIPVGDDYKVTAKKDPLTFASEGGDSFRLEGDRTGVNFRVKEETHSISGKVTDETGAVVPNVIVKTKTGKSGKTDAQGNYTIAGLPPGIYDLSVDDIAGFKFTGADKSHTGVAVIQCSKTGEDFTAARDKTPASTPAPTPTPTPKPTP